MAKGADFSLFGPPRGYRNLRGTSKQKVEFKLDPQFQVLAKMLRNQYLHDGAYATEKSYLNIVRMRQKDDTYENLKKQGLIPAVIERRDEFEDVDIVLPRRAAYNIHRHKDGYSKPYYIKINEEEEIRVTCNYVKFDRSKSYGEPYQISF